jgi:hypothetical protein
VEESFQAGKGLTGLDEHQVRRWISWQRWTLLAMAAHALLAVIAAHEHSLQATPDGLADLQRDPPPVRPIRHRAQQSPRLPTGLVTLETTPPTPLPHQPLPAPRRPPTMDITISGWSTSGALRGLSLGGSDASVIAIAERLSITTIMTTDRRHFAAVRPSHVEAFTLLP